MDITSDGFGFMLAVGDLAWVPFVYSLQARYLVFHPVELGPVYSALIVVANFTGYYIFRVANGDKNNFRNGKNPKSTRSAGSFAQSLLMRDLCRPDLYEDQTGYQANYLRLVGLLPPSQLCVCSLPRCVVHDQR